MTLSVVSLIIIAHHGFLLIRNTLNNLNTLYIENLLSVSAELNAY